MQEVQKAVDPKEARQSTAPTKGDLSNNLDMYTKINRSNLAWRRSFLSWSIKTVDQPKKILFLSKLIEKDVATRLIQHQKVNLQEQQLLQSLY